MNLEIKVFEQTKVVDNIGDAIKFISEQIKEWFDSGVDLPFNLIINKINPRGPPSLGVKVGESVELKDRLV